MPTWVQDSETGKLVPKAAYRAKEVKGPHVSRINAFTSPIDGSTIDSMGSMEAHNRKHGVTVSSDYSEQYLAERRASKQPTAREEVLDRRDAIERAYYNSKYQRGMNE